jgi:hypothetical protein
MGTGCEVLRQTLDDVSQLLINASNRQEKHPSPSSSSVGFFFDDWFRKKGLTYYFLFKKNFKVTNIQVPELLALIRTHLHESRTPVKHPQFVSISGFRNILQDVFNSFAPFGARKASTEFVARQYCDLLTRIIVLDVLFGSCVVYLPPGLDLELDRICFLSGYIHSCGRCIYICNTYKARANELFTDLTGHLAKHKSNSKRILFRPYSHEDFTTHDRDQQDDLKSGLDDVKMYAQKYFIGSESLSDVVEGMRAAYGRDLEIPPPGSSEVDAHSKSKADVDCSRTIFLVIDHSLGAVHNRPGDRHSLICYEQLFINQNPFHIFDENKPAWLDHTTIPHTLMGAMLNVTRPYWPDGTVTIGDFFLGSGTTWLETLKDARTSFFGSDHEPISALLVEDNLLFFTKTAGELSILIESLTNILTDHAIIGLHRQCSGRSFPWPLCSANQWHSFGSRQRLHSNTR